jgi:hypothetical protein
METGACCRRAIHHDHAAAGSWLGDRLRRNLLRDVVLVRGSVAAAGTACKSGREPRAVVQHRALGCMVPCSDSAGFVVQAIPARRDCARRRERGHRCHRADIVGKTCALSAEPAQGIPGSVGGSARLRLSRAAIQDCDRLRRPARQRIHAWHAEAQWLFARTAHRLHLCRRGRGARIHRSRARSGPVPCAAAPRDTDRVTRERFVRQSGRIRVDVVLARSRCGEHRHDAQPHANHRNPAAILQLRRLVHARQLAWRRSPLTHLRRGQGTCGGAAVGAGGGRAARGPL